MAKLIASVGLSLILASTAATAASTSKPVAKQPDAAERQYCFKFEGSTGTRISSTECHTKKEWKRLGVDVDELSSQDRRFGVV